MMSCIMNKPDAKKKRSDNFTEAEIKILINCVKQFASAIESKKTDADNNRMKKEAWEKVCDQYNRISGLKYRDINTLRNKYKNIKKASRACSKNELAVQKKCFIEKHKLRLDLMKAKHDAYMQQQQILFEEELKNKQEKHSLEMSVLKKRFFCKLPYCTGDYVL